MFSLSRGTPRLKFLVIVMLEFSIFVATGSLPTIRSTPATGTPLTTCQTISLPGDYFLANDISFPLEPSCITISANNVNLDCMGHLLTGPGSSNLDNGNAVTINGNSSVVRNCVMAHSGRGVAVAFQFNQIINNTIYDMQEGINLGGNTSNDTVTGNYVFDNSGAGYGLGRAFTIWCGLTTCGDFNVIVGNRFTNSQWGIDLGFPFGSDQTHGNLFYNNYVVNNTVNARDQVGGLNFWNTTGTLRTNIIGGPYTGGNFWGDYVGKDTDGDGIGDTILPYTSGGYIGKGGDSAPLVPITPITACQAISTPGEYFLANNVSFPVQPSCITISANNVSFNCIGHMLTGPGSSNLDNGNAVTINGNSSVVRNCVMAHSGRGVAVAFQFNQVINNKIFDMQEGINLGGNTSNSTVVGNNVFGNSGAGYGLGRAFTIWCGPATCGDNNTITGNRFYNSQWGIDLGLPFGTGTVHGNLFYNNYVVNNKVNARDQTGGLNYWNVTEQTGKNIVGGPYLGGNFWGDYNGTDLTADGIGDTYFPYTSNGNISISGDYLPLVRVSRSVGVSSVAPFRVRVPDPYFGVVLPIEFSVANNGNVYETVNVTAYVNDKPLFVWQGSIANATTQNLYYYWNMSAIPVGYYRVSARVTSVIAGPISSGSLAVAGAMILKAFRGEVDGDHVVDIVDLVRVARAFGSTTPPTDVNGDGVVDVADVNIVLTAWGGCSPSPPYDPYADRADNSTNGCVDVNDVLATIAAWGNAKATSGWDPYADMDGTGIIDINDLATVGATFGQTG